VRCCSVRRTAGTGSACCSSVGRGGAAAVCAARRGRVSESRHPTAGRYRVPMSAPDNREMSPDDDLDDVIYELEDAPVLEPGAATAGDFATSRCARSPPSRHPACPDGCTPKGADALVPGVGGGDAGRLVVGHYRQTLDAVSWSSAAPAKAVGLQAASSSVKKHGRTQTCVRNTDKTGSPPLVRLGDRRPYVPLLSIRSIRS
jgi:hypothetical protein